MSIRYHLFNQMAGPLFRELAIAVAESSPKGAVLFTGHPDTVALGPTLDSLEIRPMPAYDRRSRMRRLFSWLSFTSQAVLEFARMSRDDVAIVVSNPPTLGPVAWIARLFGRRYYVLVYDLHPDAMISMGALSEGSVITRTWRWINRKVWNASEGVVTLGGRMAQRLDAQFDPERTRLGRVQVVPIWVDTDVIRPVPRKENAFAQSLGVGDRVVVLYSGNMGYSHDIDSILQAAELLEDRDDILFVLIGEGARWQDAHDFMTTRGLANLKVLPFQPEEVLPHSLGMADIALVSLDSGAEGLMIPSKFYYYMAAGAAVVATCEGDSELSDTIREVGCGLILTPGRPDILAAAIRGLAEDRARLAGMGRLARDYCAAHHDRAGCAKHFINLISQ